MVSKKKEILIFGGGLLLVIVIFFGYNLIRDSGDRSFEFQELQHSRIKISSLPKEIRTSLSILEKRARETRGFRLDFISLWQQTKITEVTPLVLKTDQGGSFNQGVYVTEMPTSLVGLTVKQLKNILIDWEFASYVPGKSLVLVKTLIKTDENSGQYLGIKDDRVAIFSRKNDDYSVRLTGIQISDLPQNEQQILEKGIEIKSEEELLTILEGLISYSHD